LLQKLYTEVETCRNLQAYCEAILVYVFSNMHHFCISILSWTSCSFITDTVIFFASVIIHIVLNSCCSCRNSEMQNNVQACRPKSIHEQGNLFLACIYVSPCQYDVARPLVTDEGNGFRTWRLPPNILNKQSRTVDKRWSSNLGVG